MLAGLRVVTDPADGMLYIVSPGRSGCADMFPDDPSGSALDAVVFACLGEEAPRARYLVSHGARLAPLSSLDR